jgi:AbrB family looped-hinge helix DNA binding protein
MARIKVSSKGQVVLPKDLRERQGIDPGVELEVSERGREIVLRKVRRIETTRIEDVAGCLHRPGQRALTIREMDEGVMREAKRVGDRIKRGLG